MRDKVFDKIICGYTQATTTTKDSTTESEREKEKDRKGKRGKGLNSEWKTFT